MTKTHLSPFEVSFQSTTARIPPLDNVLEDRFLHKLFLLAHAPARWRGWQLAAVLLAAAAGVWAGWWWLTGAGATIAAAMYLVFAASDWLLFWWLPRARRSFGPVGPQVLTTTTPRLLAVVVAALVGWLTGATAAGLGLLLGLQLFGSLVYGWGALHEPFALSVSRQQTPAARWTPAAPPLHLLHLSDLHVERRTPREAHLLQLVGQIQPDIIVITGDYLNLSYVNDPTARAEVRQVLQQLTAPLGVYAILGSPPVDPRNTTPSLFDDLPNIRLLRDEVAVLTLPDGRKLSLLGLDCEHDLESDASAFRGLIELAPADSVRVLLYHSPELMPLVQQYAIDLYLCGHTHGGQIRVPGYGAILTSSITGKQYEMGRYHENGTTLYISRGIGLEGLSAPRMRLLCPPEIILFSLG